MNDKLVVSEVKLKQLLQLIEEKNCKKNDTQEHINLFYCVAPEIKEPHRKIATGFQR